MSKFDSMGFNPEREGKNRETKLLGGQRIAQLRRLGGLLGVSFDDSPESSLRDEFNRLKEMASDTDFDGRPSAQQFQDQIDRINRLPGYVDGYPWSGTEEDVLGELFRVAANDFDGNISLPTMYDNKMAGNPPAYLFEMYRGWTTEDFVKLFTLLETKLPFNNLGEMREDALKKQEGLAYDEERDLKVITDHGSPLICRGFAMDRLINKIQREPEYLTAVEAKLLSQGNDVTNATENDKENISEQMMFAKKIIDSVKQELQIRQMEK